MTLTSPPLQHGPDLGVCYYPEQWPREKWEHDAAEMVALGLTWVRIAETTTDADGAFLASTPWKRGGLARATAQGVSSLPVSVAVLPALEVAADAATIPAGGGEKTKGRQGAPVSLQTISEPTRNRSN